MTIITGPNGAGKTTVLNMISRTMGWQVALLALPDSEAKSVESDLGDPNLFTTNRPAPNGYVETGDGRISLRLQDAKSISHIYNAVGSTKGVYITSHRQKFIYSPIASIPLKVDSMDAMLLQYTNRYRSSYAKQSAQELLKAEDSPSYRLKSCLMSMAVFGEGNSKVSPDHRLLSAFLEFEEILRVVLPEEIGFQKFYIRMPELLLISNVGAFPIEALSGGAAAIVDLAWQMFLASKIYDDFIAMIDEPENHLHPSMQTRLLPSLLKAFPRAQFIAATHSPLMINSVESSNVYVVRRSDESFFSSELLDMINRASSSNEVLYDVLGVDATVPAWAEERFQQIVQQYDGKAGDAGALKEMARALRDAGMGDRIAAAFEKVSEPAND